MLSLAFVLTGSTLCVWFASGLWYNLDLVRYGPSSHMCNKKHTWRTSTPSPRLRAVIVTLYLCCFINPRIRYYNFYFKQLFPKVFLNFSITDILTQIIICCWRAGEGWGVPRIVGYLAAPSASTPWMPASPPSQSLSAKTTPGAECPLLNHCLSPLCLCCTLQHVGSWFPSEGSSLCPP